MVGEVGLCRLGGQVQGSQLRTTFQCRLAGQHGVVVVVLAGSSHDGEELWPLRRKPYYYY